ncbi:sensor histidine kinase [Rhodovibrio salinarum]|uniref:histidine kinase n=1 Tax=Rhodovibrio salinarum TaxID=1087 RepID=A0A934QJS0_9PROT|nr:HAMP domain-containing sensor histidine kinase [Rhodovibrio salinarum]MBK1698176.1 sensor histidine kinase [Rhodovibrio salinarum]
MRLNRLLRSSTFRLTLIYFLLFGLSSAGLLAFVYLTTVQVITHQTDETIRAEALGLVEQYEDGGLPGLERIVTDRSRSGIGEIGIYLLADEQYQRVAGNLPQWPEQARGVADWYQFPIQGLHGGGHMQVARARTYTLSDDYHLLVGRDMTERSEFRTLISEALLGALGLTVMFGGAGGLFMSRWLLGRIDRVNRTSQQILEGDLSHRVPLDGSDDEFDRLAGNLNRMLDQIEQLIASMRSVSDNIAHDLRTPISRLRSRLEVTLLSDRDTEAYRDAIQDAIGEADQILNTFNALLDIALAESGALRDQFEQVDLTAVVDDVVDLYEPLAEELDVTLSKRTASDVWIDGNAHLLSQALANLIDNAIKYTPSGGVIVVTNQQHDGKVDLCVSDSGPGIPADKRAEVLKRFSRLEHSRSAAGSGLGLSLVAAVARLHEAEIELSDNAPGLVVRLRFG